MAVPESQRRSHAVLPDLPTPAPARAGVAPGVWNANPAVFRGTIKQLHGRVARRQRRSEALYRQRLSRSFPADDARAAGVGARIRARAKPRRRDPPIEP